MYVFSFILPCFLVTFSITFPFIMILMQKNGYCRFVIKTESNEAVTMQKRKIP